MSAQGPSPAVRVSASQEAGNSTSLEKAEPNPYQRNLRMNDSSTQQSREPVDEDPRRHSYWVASIVLTVISLLMAIGSVVTAAVMFKKIDDEPGEVLSHLVPFILYIVTMVEAALCLIAMIVVLALLACRPRAVLIRDRKDGSFVCLCVSIFFLFLLAVYSFCVPIIVKNDPPKVSAALCVIPGVRFIALLSFFAVLVANSQL